MNPIQKLLERWARAVPEDAGVREALPAIIQTHTRARVEKKDISVSRGVAFIRCSSLAKTEIFIKKEAILRDLVRATAGGATIKDIK